MGRKMARDSFRTSAPLGRAGVVTPSAWQAFGATAAIDLCRRWVATATSAADRVCEADYSQVPVNKGSPHRSVVVPGIVLLRFFERPKQPPIIHLSIFNRFDGSPTFWGSIDLNHVGTRLNGTALHQALKGFHQLLFIDVSKSLDLVLQIEKQFEVLLPAKLRSFIIHAPILCPARAQSQALCRRTAPVCRCGVG
jgi:hypothetical protein